MDFTRLSIKAGIRAQRGGTLVELLVGMALSVMAGLAAVTFSVNSGKNMACLFNYIDMQQSSRLALDVLSQEIRQTSELQEYATNRLAFLDHDGSSLIFEYSPGKRNLARIKNGVSRVLLSECDSLNFTIYRLSPTPGSLVHEVSTTPASAKVISVSWACSRPILGVSLTTERVDGARIVMRKD